MDKWIVIERRYRFEGTPLFFAVKVTKETDKRWYYLPPDPKSNWRSDTERYIPKGDNRVSPPFPTSVAAQQRIADLEDVYDAEIKTLESQVRAANTAVTNLRVARRKDLKAEYEG